jgi:protein-tyrosine-phosphatase
MATRVLFLCTGNSARSQIAEGLLRSIGGPDFEAHSAGTRPRPDVHPAAVRAMADAGVDIGSQRPKDSSAFERQRFDFVVTVCDRAREACPVLPGAETVHWSFPDPAEAPESEQASAFRDTVFGIRRRIELFVTVQRHGK